MNLSFSAALRTLFSKSSVDAYFCHEPKYTHERIPSAYLKWIAISSVSGRKKLVSWIFGSYTLSSDILFRRGSNGFDIFRAVMAGKSISNSTIPFKPIQLSHIKRCKKVVPLRKWPIIKMGFSICLLLRKKILSSRSVRKIKPDIRPLIIFISVNFENFMGRFIFY